MHRIPASILVALLTIIWLSALGCNNYGKKETFSGDGEVFYKEGVTAEEARKVGEFLHTYGYFNGKGRKSVQLLKSGDTFQVRFVVKEDMWQVEEVVNAMLVMGGVIASEALDGKPLEVHLCDDRLKTKHTINAPPLGKALTFGKGEQVRYLPDEIKADAQKLGEVLQKIGYFNDKGNKDVQLKKSAAGFDLCLVVQEKFWDKPETQEVMKKVATQIKAQVFPNATLTIHLCDMVFSSRWSHTLQ